jgi:hypothetical protein
MNIHEVTAKYDALLTEQKKTLHTMDKLLLLAEQLLHDVEKRVNA